MSAKLEIPDDLAETLAQHHVSVEGVLRKALEHLPRPVAPSAWTRHGVTLPDGTHLRAWHAGRAWWAEIARGKILFRGEEFDAPSQVALRIAGRPINGWEFWEAHIPGVKGWTVLADLRRRRVQ